MPGREGQDATTKLRDDSGKWQRSPTCCCFKSVMEQQQHPPPLYSPCTYADKVQKKEDNSCEDLGSVSATNFNQDQELAEESDYEGDRDDTDAGTWPLDTETNCGTMSMEVDPIQEHRETRMENLLWNEAEILPQSNGKKRAIATTEEESSSKEPPTKRKEILSTDSEVTVQLLTKTAKAIEQGLGTCEEVVKYDKLKQSATKSPKSRYHIELPLKKYKQLYNDLKENPQDASKRKQLKSA